MFEYAPVDPVDYVGTPEFNEQRESNHRLRMLMLDLLQEQHDADQLQFPYRHQYKV